jgi:hypothetical protein
MISRRVLVGSGLAVLGGASGALLKVVYQPEFSYPLVAPGGSGSYAPVSASEFDCSVQLPVLGNNCIYALEGQQLICRLLDKREDEWVLRLEQIPMYIIPGPSQVCLVFVSSGDSGNTRLQVHSRADGARVFEIEKQGRVSITFANDRLWVRDSTGVWSYRLDTGVGASFTESKSDRPSDAVFSHPTDQWIAMMEKTHIFGIDSESGKLLFHRVFKADVRFLGNSAGSVNCEATLNDLRYFIGLNSSGAYTWTSASSGVTTDSKFGQGRVVYKMDGDLYIHPIGDRVSTFHVPWARNDIASLVSIGPAGVYVADYSTVIHYPFARLGQSEWTANIYYPNFVHADANGYWMLDSWQDLYRGDAAKGQFQKTPLLRNVSPEFSGDLPVYRRNDIGYCSVDGRLL